MPEARREIGWRDRPARLALLSIRSLAELERALHGLGFSAEAWLAVDLTLGGWIGHQAARELLGQLGCPGELGASRLFAAGEIHRAEKSDAMLGRLIEAESRGNTAVLSALDFAERTAGAIAARGEPTAVAVLVPRWGLPWRRENLAFLTFLAQGLATGPSRVLIVTLQGDDPVLPAHWRVETLEPAGSGDAAEAAAPAPGLLSWVPGLARPEWLEALGVDSGDASREARTLPGGFLLVPPEWRSRPAPRNRTAFDRLAAGTALPEAVRAFGQIFGNAYFRDPGVLCQAAWMRFAEGAHEIADDLMARVAETAPSLEERLRFLWELQGMRIAAQDFATAAAIGDVPSSIAPELRGGIAMTRGWALTMLGDGAAGRAQFEQARALLGETLAGSRFGLYLDNIYALSLVRCGEADRALEVERGIASQLAERCAAGERDRALEYVNAINQARLLRLTGDLDACERAYRRAFAITLGTRTENDLLYTNFCLARVLTDRGRVREAFGHRLRAALHWVAAACPEAVTARIAGGVLGRRVEAPERCAEELSAALDGQLLEAARAAGVDLPEPLRDGAEVPVFRRLAAMTAIDLSGATLFGVEGASAVASPAAHVPPFDSPAHRRLRARLAALLCAGFGDEVGAVRTIFIDDGYGCEMPATLAECRLAAARLGLSRMCFDSAVEILPPVSEAGIFMDCRVAIGPAVASLRLDSQPGRARFTRFLAERSLTEPETQLLRRLCASSIEGQPMPLSALVGDTAGPAARNAAWALCRVLEEARVLRLEASDVVPYDVRLT